MTEPRSYVQPEVGEARVNRLWSGVSARLTARPQRSPRGWLVAAAALTLAAAGGAALLLRTPAGAPAEQTPVAVLSGASLQTASDALSVTLDDGSSLVLASHTRVAVRGNQPSSVALELSQGQLRCSVTHRPERAFTVTSGDVEVRVVGTRFSVEAKGQGSGARVQVSVQQGVVEVRSARQPGIVERVGAGQSWSQEPQAAPPPAASTTAALPLATAAPSSKPEAASSAGSPTPAGPSARDLFEKAGERRRAGDAAAAARAYEGLLQAHPRDARASLAAFELGRLRMDRLGDPAGAIAALERAVALGVGPSFREDALARLVSAYAGLGHFAACGRARDRYLQSYPHGVHATAVASRCGKL